MHDQPNRRDPGGAVQPGIRAGGPSAAGPVFVEPSTVIRPDMGVSAGPVGFGGRGRVLFELDPLLPPKDLIEKKTVDTYSTLLSKAQSNIIRTWMAPEEAKKVDASSTGLKVRGEGTVTLFILYDDPLGNGKKWQKHLVNRVVFAGGQYYFFENPAPPEPK